MLHNVCTILGQDFEIIVVNDGSNEKYSSLVDELTACDSRIKVLNQDNRGVSAARNAGVAIATGQFVMFVDADDEIAAGALREAVDAQSESAADFTIGAAERTHLYDGEATQEGPALSVLSAEEIRMLRGHLIGGDLYWFQHGGFLGRGPWSRLLRSDIAKRVAFDERLVQGEDVVWNLQVLEHCETVCLVDSVWYLYYFNPHSITHRYNFQIYDDICYEMQCIKSVLDLTLDNEFRVFCDKCLDEVKKISIYVMYHPNSTLTKTERLLLEENVYTDTLWYNDICSKRYEEIANWKYRIKRQLFMSRTLITFSYIYNSLVNLI